MSALAAGFRQYLDLVSMNLRMYRQAVWLLGMVNIAFAVGLVVGFGYVIPEVSKTTALYLVTGTATQMVVTVGLVGLPQFFAEAKKEGRLDFFMTLPISREAYLLAQVTFVLIQVLPAIAFALALGAWHYDFRLEIDPALALVIPLAVLSLAGLGVAIAILSPHLQLTNAITQLVIFYVLFFAPVIVPKEQLPDALEVIGRFLPPTYVADAIRASVTDLPGTHLWRSIGLMALFGVASMAVAAAALRRRA